MGRRWSVVERICGKSFEFWVEVSGSDEWQEWWWWNRLNLGKWNEKSMKENGYPVWTCSSSKVVLWHYHFQVLISYVVSICRMCYIYCFKGQYLIISSEIHGAQISAMVATYMWNMATTLAVRRTGFIYFWYTCIISWLDFFNLKNNCWISV